MRVQPPGCAQCPAFGQGRGFVPFEGKLDARLLLIGQGPGETEAQLGSPFCGPLGQMLNKWLGLAGIDRSSALVGNVALCWLPENRPPRRVESNYCRATYWDGLVANRSVIVPIGVPAMAHFYPGKVSDSCGGRIIRHDSGAYVVGLIHPGSIVRGSWGLESAQIQALIRVKKILDGWEPEIPDFDLPPPGANLFPTLAELEAWTARLRPEEHVAIDVEAAGNILRMIGLDVEERQDYVAIHFRQKGGASWIHCSGCGGRDGGHRADCRGGEDRFTSVIEWLYDHLRSAQPKVFQNGASYDIVEQLEEVGFEVNGYSFDTLLAMHIAFPESRKRLEHISMVTTGVSGWKAKLREGEGHWK